MTDLKALSDAASPGPWYNCHVRGWGSRDSASMISLRNHDAKDIAGDCPLAVFKDKAVHWENSHPFLGNAAFVTALVNAYRDGRLVEK